MRAVDIIIRKRDGAELSAGEIDFLVQGITDGTVPDYQIAAWAMAVLWRGMTIRETAQLTRAMAESGASLDAEAWAPGAVDKHSTGGVGDKTTLVVEPIVAACGLPVMKMSGRGLGISGGTIDKWESIPGFRTNLTREEILRQLKEIGMVACAQTAELAPADGKLYALRDVTGTIPSVPLIASSIMSKKIATGARAIVLDVKAGTGAFMGTVAEAATLAQWMVRIGKRAGRRTVALVSGMFQPLGFAVGNALEVREAMAALRGEGPADLREHCLTIAGYMLHLGGRTRNPRLGRALAAEKLADGTAFAKFRALIRAQGGDERICDDPSLLPSAPCRGILTAGKSGYLAEAHAGKIGLASVRLGAGRAKKGDSIDPAVGIVLRGKVGDPVRKGDPLCEVHAATEKALAQGLSELEDAFVIKRGKVKPLPLFYKSITK
ncbi:MAG: thymidine phosphorylase [Anaerolineales bacterium]|nr:thymidine phosphorylase [Anaerolineales bacterium]